MFSTCDGSRWRKAFSNVCLKFVVVILILIVASLAVDSWSTGSATVTMASGEVTIGLWKACASVPGRRIFSNQEEGEDCRYGHCIESTFMTPRTRAGAHDLCGSGKATASFALIGVICCLAIIYHLSYVVIIGREPSHGKASIYAVLLAFCVMISWSVWIGWQQKFNNDSNRKSSESPLQFSRLDLSAGPILMIIAFIVAVFNAIIQVLHFISAIKREAEVKAQRNSTAVNQSFEQTSLERLRESVHEATENTHV